MEKLADALQQLQEDDLLKVVQMVHEHKTTETYVKNDVERTDPLFLPVICSTSIDIRCRGRIPCRSVHPSRTPHQDAMEVCSRRRYPSIVAPMGLSIFPMCPPFFSGSSVIVTRPKQSVRNMCHDHFIPLLTHICYL